MSRSLNYDGLAGTYDERYRFNRYPGIERTLLRLIEKNVGGSAPCALEVGCGTGHWAAWLERQGRCVRVLALDPSAEMLRCAQKKVQHAALVRGRAEQLPCAEGFLRWIFCINAFHHFGDKIAFLAQARRALQPGGMLLIVGLDPHLGLDRWPIYEFFDGSLQSDLGRYPSTSQLRQWMRAAGFSNCTTTEVEHLKSRIHARGALDSGQLSKSSTSQLALLSEAEYEAGLARIKNQLALTDAKGESLFLEVDLRLFGTFGRVPPLRRLKRRRNQEISKVLPAPSCNS